MLQAVPGARPGSVSVVAPASVAVSVGNSYSTHHSDNKVNIQDGGEKAVNEQEKKVKVRAFFPTLNFCISCICSELNPLY